VLQTTGSYAINQAFYGMQPGTGTFDIMPGILYGGVQGAWSWGRAIALQNRVSNLAR
jgi:hypothetical protein